MRKKNKVLLFMLILLMSLGLTFPAGATTSTGTIDVDCAGARFQGTVAVGDTARLEVRLHESDPSSPRIQDDYIPLPEGPYDVFVPWVADPDGRFYRTAIRVNGMVIVVDEGTLDCPPPPGGEGCTPGYWKNHLEDWPPTGLSPGDDFDTTFGVDLFNPDITLDDAVNAKGGGVKKVARHGTAGLLSAAHPDVDYPYSVAEVIAFVQAGDADPLVAANELGCVIP